MVFLENSLVEWKEHQIYSQESGIKKKLRHLDEMNPTSSSGNEMLITPPLG